MSQSISRFLSSTACRVVQLPRLTTLCQQVTADRLMMLIIILFAQWLLSEDAVDVQETVYFSDGFKCFAK